MVGMLESIVMKKCNLSSREAKKIAMKAREQLQIASSVLWSKELEATCLRLYHDDSHDCDEKNRDEKIEKRRETTRQRSNSDTSCWSEIIGSEDRIDTKEKKRTARSLSKPRKKSTEKSSLSEMNDDNGNRDDEIILSRTVILRKKSSRRQLNDSGKNDSWTSVSKSPLSLTSNGTQGSLKSRKSATSSGTATSRSTNKSGSINQSSASSRGISRPRGDIEKQSNSERLRQRVTATEFVDNENINSLTNPSRGRPKQRHIADETSDRKLSSALSRKLLSDTDQTPLRRRQKKTTTDDSNDLLTARNEKLVRRNRSSDSTDAIDGNYNNSITDEDNLQRLKEKKMVRRLRSTECIDVVDENRKYTQGKKNPVESTRRSPSTIRRRMISVSDDEDGGNGDKNFKSNDRSAEDLSKKSILRKSVRKTPDSVLHERSNEAQLPMKLPETKHVGNQSRNNNDLPRKLKSKGGAIDNETSSPSKATSNSTQIATTNAKGYMELHFESLGEQQQRSPIRKTERSVSDKFSSATYRDSDIDKMLTEAQSCHVRSTFDEGDKTLTEEKATKKYYEATAKNGTNSKKMSTSRKRFSIHETETDLKADTSLRDAVLSAKNNRLSSVPNISSLSDWNEFSKSFDNWNNDHFNDKPDIHLVSSKKINDLGQFIENPNTKKNDDTQTVSTGSGSMKSKTRMLPVVKSKISNIPVQQQEISPFGKKEYVGINVPTSPRLSMVPLIRGSSPTGKQSPNPRLNSILRHSKSVPQHDKIINEKAIETIADPIESPSSCKGRAYTMKKDNEVVPTSPSNKFSMHPVLRKSPINRRTTETKVQMKNTQQIESSPYEAASTKSRHWTSEKKPKNISLREHQPSESSVSQVKKEATANKNSQKLNKVSTSSREGLTTESTVTNTSRRSSDEDDIGCTSNDLPIHHRHVYKETENNLCIKEDEIFPEFAPSRFTIKVKELTRKPSLHRRQLVVDSDSDSDSSNNLQTQHPTPKIREHQHVQDNDDSSNNSKTKLFQQSTSTVAPKVPQRRQSIQDHC